MTAKRITGTAQGLSVDRKAPSAIQLWNAGDNPTDYGVHVWNARSIVEVLARYNERGNPILVDVEHNGAQLEDGEPAPTAGYARLEIRAGAPWLVFEWSDYGRSQIASGQRRFLSPEYDVDKNTGEILALYRVSLVADPGTHRARMLATAMHEENSMDLTVVLAALRAALAAEDPAVAKESISNLLAELEKQNGGGAPDAGASPDAPTDDVVDAGAGDAPPGDDADKDKDKQMTTAKSVKAPAAAKAPVKSEPKDKVNAAADDAVRVIQNATRDHLIATHGDKLEPSIRRWASSQPLEVVRGLLDATPAKEAPKTRAPATRGGGGGAASLSERELTLCTEKKIDPAKYAETRARIAARSNGTGA